MDIYQMKTRRRTSRVKHVKKNTMEMDLMRHIKNRATTQTLKKTNTNQELDPLNEQ